jgi:outer membrane protein assembly factor BamA
VWRFRVVLMRILKKIYYSCLLLVITANAVAQNVEVSLPADKQLASLPFDSSAKLAVRKIILKGNKKTRNYLILREIQFKPGDSIIIGTINDAFQMARQQVYNTTLFHEVNVDLAMVSAYEMDVIVTVKERWYVFPLLEFKVIDRSFNEWLVTHNGDLSRVNYGLKFEHKNFSGRRDPLRLFLITGYNQNVAFSYSQPYSDKALTQGFGIGGGFLQNRETAIKTSYDNKIQFYKSDDFVRKNLYLNLSLRLQKGILYRHILNLAFSRLTVSDSVISSAYNPHYFNTNANTAALVDFSYTYQYANVNNVAYPLKGKTGYFALTKRGLGLTGGTNLFAIDGAYNKFWAHKKNWFTALQFRASVKLPFEQPYINQNAIGYGDANLRGLEFYVIDGVAFGIVKSTLKKKLFSFTIPLSKNSRLLPTLPFSIFAKTYADAGYSFNKKKFDSFLNNRLLYTAGFGIDILTVYDIRLRIEYSFNQLSRNQFFFESK